MSTSNQNKIKNNCPIGFFDSGVGGLSVYSCFKKALPCENTLYYGDIAHLPYGNKTKEELVGYARGILDFYKTQDVKAVVIACNTSSAQAYDVIKDEYDFRIYPIIQSCAKVIANQNINRIGVFATVATVNSGVYAKELKKYKEEYGNATREKECCVLDFNSYEELWSYFLPKLKELKNYEEECKWVETRLCIDNLA